MTNGYGAMPDYLPSFSGRSLGDGRVHQGAAVEPEREALRRAARCADSAALTDIAEREGLPRIQTTGRFAEDRDLRHTEQPGQRNSGGAASAESTASIRRTGGRSGPGDAGGTEQVTSLITFFEGR